MFDYLKQYRPASFIPYVLVFFVLVEILVFFTRIKEKPSLVILLTLLTGKLISVVAPYQVSIVKTRMEMKDAGDKYLAYVLEYVYESHELTVPFVFLLVLVEIPLFILLTGKEKNKRKLLSMFVAVNTVFLLLMLMIDKIICRDMAGFG